jgi:hypothetical protein
MAVHQSRWGAKLGPRVAMLVSQSIVYTHAKLLHVKHKLAMKVFHSISDEISNEVDVTLGPFLEKLHDLTPEDHPAYPMVHFMHTATGQLKALAGTGLQISGLLGSVSAIMNNELAPVVYAYVGLNPHLLPDTGTLAELFASGQIPLGQAVSSFGDQGIDSGWAEAILRASLSYPTPADALDMLRRGIINDDDFRQWCVQNGFQGEIPSMLLALKTLPLSPADLALAVLRGNMDQNTGTSRAAESGLQASDFQVLLDNTGEPPGLEQLLEGYRRGFIDEATLKKGILQSRYRNEWIPLLEQLRYEPMSTADAVNATVQSQIAQSDAEKIASQNGLEPEYFQVLLNTAGEPLSRTELEQLYNRGLITRDQVIQGLKESRLKIKYNDMAFELHTKLLDPSVLQHAVLYGTISQSDAVKTAMMYGYSEKDATTLIAASANQRLQVYRDRVVGAVTTMIEDNLISPDAASSAIVGLGYSQADAGFIVESASFHQNAKMVNTVVTELRTKFISHKITQQEASGYLSSVGIPATQRDNLLALWSVEAAAYVRTLTEAQIVKAVNNDLITPQDGLTRLTDMGYSPDDATLLLNGA